MATTFPSARGQKPTEVAHRSEGRNTIVTVWKSGAVVAPREWGPDYATFAGTIEAALDATIAMGRVPLLWTYAELDGSYVVVKFGFDDPIGNNKIGHVAMTEEATISGEIYREGAHWKINNESGAWGNMGGHGGKTAKLTDAALFMTANCGPLQVQASRAYSRTGWKRKIQQVFR